VRNHALRDGRSSPRATLQAVATPSASAGVSAVPVQNRLSIDECQGGNRWLRLLAAPFVPTRLEIMGPSPRVSPTIPWRIQKIQPSGLRPSSAIAPAHMAAPRPKAR
jgi:hypothetical protein